MTVLPLRRWLQRPDAAPSVLSEAIAAPTSVEAPTVDDETAGRLLDAIGTLIQLSGAYAHDTDTRAADDARRVAEQWRRHLMLGLDHPTTTDIRADAPRGCSVAQRDWAGAARFAVGDRRAEHAYVTRAMTELRDTVWTLVRGLHRVADADGDAGRASARAIERHTQAVRDADAESMRSAALAALGELSTVLSTRERERSQQIATLGAQITSLGSALDAAKRDSETDALTSLGNRRAFDGAIEDAVALHGLWRQPACLVALDVDGLKLVNDTLGHAAGDDVLRQIAQQLARVFLRRTDVLTRTGGDEFAVVLRDTSRDDAARVTARLAAFVAAMPVADSPLRVGISAGLAALRDGETAAEWSARADTALYRAKNGGRGRVELS